ncbi:MAG: hypothetical protein JWL90_1919, partial [Chthoniobacteraceae bacterium]|nr:hypothetical protein [Chthoniobacteraceae bacterium]
MSDLSPPDDSRRLDLFLQALEMNDPSERASFVSEACSGDEALQQWVENELQSQTSPEDEADRIVTAALESAPADVPLSPETEALLAALKPEEAGDQIGVYKLIEQLGEGAFGVVWMAEQQKPVSRQVAIKILKVGMDSRQIVGRFEQERQALAMLDHPGIAKVFDAGATDTGRLFFVMELVRGKPITDYCDEARFPIRQRLELLMRVCYAVQHAHQKGIIHRDLKPSNILVAQLTEGRPTPKVIDLGLAKATQGLASEHTMIVTQGEKMIGTPLYMSPEQAEGSFDLDTRTDIYALGVVLYELLTGRTPHDPDEIARGSHEEIRRAIREQEPPLPSNVLRTLANGALSTVAHRRGTEPRFLIRAVAGELDAICMKAIEKDRRGRYATAGALAADLQHYLLNEPITARAQSQWYRARKFAVRNRRVLIGASLIVVTILTGSFISIRETLRAQGAEQQAIAAQTKEAEQRQRAELEKERARLNEYIADIGLSQQSLANGNLGRAVQLLEKHRPAPGESDLRGWAWRYLWKLCQGGELATFPDLGAPANAMTFSSKGDLLAVAAREKVLIYDVATRSIMSTLSPGADSMSFLPDGQTLLTSGPGGTRAWRRADWTWSQSWPGDSGPLALSPDGSRLAVVCREGVRIRETVAWKEERLIPGARPPMAFAPDNRSLVTETRNGVALWREEVPQLFSDSGKLFSREDGGLPRSAQGFAFSRDGESLVTLQNGLSERGIFLLRIWDVKTGTEIAVMPEDVERPEHTGVIRALTISPDGKTLATASMDHSVRLWDLARRQRVAILQGHRAEVGAVAFAPDGETVVSCDRLGHVKQWAVRREKTEDIISEILRPLGFSSDGRTLAALTTLNTVVFYDAETKAVQKEFAIDAVRPGLAASVAMSADMRTLAQALDDGHVRIWNVETGEVKTVKISERAVRLIAFMPDCQTLITGSRGEHLRTRDLRTGAEASLPFAADRIIISPDSCTLAVFPPGSRFPGFPSNGLGGPAGPPDRMPPGNENILRWDLLAGTALAHFTVSSRSTLDAEFSPDGCMFA